MSTWQRGMRCLQAVFLHANPFHRTTVTIDGQPLDVNVATTPEQWACGLTAPIDAEALLFVLDGRRLPFTMHGVNEPVLIAFFSERGEQVDVAILQAHNGFRWPTADYRYALELPCTSWHYAPPLLTGHAWLNANPR